METTLFQGGSLCHIKLVTAGRSHDPLFAITTLYKIQCMDHLSNTKLNVAKSLHVGL